ncbi:uncharacterized protein ARMOST_06803 [Armillaria ostoyae]|uniref:Uncharacterized protein n=1 Tax=Armillaria ostoyae TaxID=47428 RepID=A0A284R413_ARMOS|nr:uncharacterized protein ARMOST_06803 [Armillaria ostoyae]
MSACSYLRKTRSCSFPSTGPQLHYLPLYATPKQKEGLYE